MTDDSQEAKTVATYDTYAESWVTEHDDRTDYQAMIRLLQRYVPKGEILEIGAGGGSDAVLLHEAGYNYLGTDVSAGMVEAAKRHHPDLRFQQLSVYDLASLDRQFEGFWACAVLLHVPKARIDEALQAVRAVIKLGGAGFISMKDGTDEVFESRLKNDRQEERLFAYWQDEKFRKALIRNGFEVVEYQYKPESERTRWHRYIVRKTHAEDGAEK
jgi:2-polyprenyl-3-methyl-5-hydroxy-6-metoxy-1,4-benzoquinol methylase